MPLNSIGALRTRPGFMIRRAHQIATDIFLAETADLGITTTQFGLLSVLKSRPSIDQRTAARMLGLDRSTAGMVLKSLEGAGYVARIIEPADKRRRCLELTPKGAELLMRLNGPAERAVDRLLAPLDAAERPVFLSLLAKLTEAFNPVSRVPLSNEQE